MRRSPLVLLVALALAPAVHAETTRFALVVGNNAGRADLPPLHFAEADAGKVARVLVELGGVAPENLMLLQGRPANELEAAIVQMRAKIEPVKASPDARIVLIFYFSGHSDGDGIELGNAILSYSRLKALLGGAGADVRVLIVDACRSGAGFREKGGRPTEGFAIKLTDALSTSGEAFITSSTEDEPAVETGEVSGSIFTHNLVSGLRGAADTSGDRQVTLSEAYRYAYEQTVSRTALMQEGAQHPSYDYRLSGQGELVLTSLLKPSATLLFPPGAERSVVTDVMRDQVVVEVPGAAAQTVALPPGQYGVRLFKEGRSFGGRFTLVEGARRQLTWDELTPIAAATALARKGPGVEQQVEPKWDEQRVLGLSGGVVPSVASLGLQGMLRVSGEPRSGRGLQFALIGAHTQLKSVSESAVELRAGYRLAMQLGPVWLGGGLEVGPAVVWQSTGSGVAASVAGVAAPHVAVRLWFTRAVSITLDGEAALDFLSVNSKLSVVFRPAASLGVALRF